MALPTAIPTSIQLDVSELELGQTLHVSDLPVIEGVTYVADPDHTLVTVLAPRVEEPEAPVEGEEGEEGEAPPRAPRPRPRRRPATPRTTTDLDVCAGRRPAQSRVTVRGHPAQPRWRRHRRSSPTAAPPPSVVRPASCGPRWPKPASGRPESCWRNRPPFMNDSGPAVASLLRYYDTSLDRLLVVHDEIDLGLGVLRVHHDRRCRRAQRRRLGDPVHRARRSGGCGAGSADRPVSRDPADYVLERFRSKRAAGSGADGGPCRRPGRGVRRRRRAMRPGSAPASSTPPATVIHSDTPAVS